MKSLEFQNVLRLLRDEEDKVFVAYFMGHQISLTKILIMYFFYKNPDELRSYLSNGLGRYVKHKRRQLFSRDYFRLFIDYLHDAESIYDHKLIQISDENFDIIMRFKKEFSLKAEYKETYSDEFRRLDRIRDEVEQMKAGNISKIYHQYCL
ncbi:MAG: hypothetical protein PHO92_00830 [Candidatus Peribacteraceae bacterium]|nr:hypothetical protein [Candidatus Peribacteraceae bacterium]